MLAVGLNVRADSEFLEALVNDAAGVLAQSETETCRNYNLKSLHGNIQKYYKVYKYKKL